MKLVLGSLVVLAHATGCIIDADDDSSGEHAIVTWSLESLATQSVQPCPVGYDTAAVYSQQLDAANEPIGDAVIDLFNCSDGSGVTSSLAAATYSVTVAIATDDNSLQYGTSVPLAVAIAADQTEVDTPPIYTDAGHFELQWQLQQSGAIVPCSAVPNAVSIGVTAIDAGGNSIVSPPFACTDPVGYTAGLLDGTYTVDVALLDGTGAQIAAAVPIDGATIQTTATQGNTITQLPATVTVPVP